MQDKCVISIILLKGGGISGNSTLGCSVATYADEQRGLAVDDTIETCFVQVL